MKHVNLTAAEKAAKPRAASKDRLARNSTLRVPAEPMRKKSAKRDLLYKLAYLPAREKYLQSHRLCEVKTRNCTKWSRDVHHRRPRSTDASEANLVDPEGFVAVCRSCHDRITFDPKWATANGWIVR